MPPLLIADLGLLSWSDAYALQQRIVAARKAGAIDDVLLFCEHPHVPTLGRNASQKNLLASENVLRQKNVELRETNRGGDITYHGPGQVVGYPILNLDAIHRDVHWYVRTLEEAMIRASADFGISAYRISGKTGIWVQPSGNIPEENSPPSASTSAAGSPPTVSPSTSPPTSATSTSSFPAASPTEKPPPSKNSSTATSLWTR